MADLDMKRKKSMIQAEPELSKDLDISMEQHQMNNLQMQLLRNDLQGDAVSQEEQNRIRQTKKAQKEKSIRMEILQDLTDIPAAIQFPKKSVLSDDFKDTFRSKLSDNARAQKQQNKKSRLYQKRKNAESLNTLEDAVYREGFQQMEAMLPADHALCDSRELADLAAFVKEGSSLSENTVKLFLGEGEDHLGQNREKALDQMYAELTSFHLIGIDLFNDKVLTDHAKDLERLSWQISAFDSLAYDCGYMEHMDEKTRKSVQKKLEELQSVVTYYQFRKEVICDPMYQSHYNEELSMDLFSAKTPAETALAKKLLKAHLAGVDMLEKNNGPAKSITALNMKTLRYQKSEHRRRLVEQEKKDLFLGVEFRGIREKYQDRGGRPMEMAERMQQRHQDYYRRKEEAEKLSQSTNMVPVFSDQEYAEKKDIVGFEGMSETQWKTFGGVTTEKVMPTEDAARIVKESKGFLVAVPVEGKKGLSVLRPSLPAKAEIAGKQVALRKSYNLLIKSYMMLATNEDGSYRPGAAEEPDGVCQQFDYITYGLYGEMADASKEVADAVRARAAGYLKTTFLPVIQKILEDDYTKRCTTKKQKDEAKKKAKKEAEKTCEDILLMAEHADGELVPSEVSMRFKVKDCAYLMDTRPEKLKEIVSGFDIREIQYENGEEKVVSRKPTEEEIEAVIAELKGTVTQTFADLKQVRDMDVNSAQIAIPNACSANGGFTRLMQKLSHGSSRPNLEHRFQAYAAAHPEEVRQYLRRNLYLLADSVGLAEDTINDYKKRLDALEFQKDKSYSLEKMPEPVKELCDIARKFNKFDYHVAANICSAPYDGCVTVEGMAATSDEYMGSSFTMKPYVGLYYGGVKVLSKDKAISVEGFAELNNSYSPYAADVKSALKTRLKLYLLQSEGQGLND